MLTYADVCRCRLERAARTSSKGAAYGRRLHAGVPCALCHMPYALCLNMRMYEVVQAPRMGDAFMQVCLMSYALCLMPYALTYECTRSICAAYGRRLQADVSICAFVLILFYLLTNSIKVQILTKSANTHTCLDSALIGHKAFFFIFFHAAATAARGRRDRALLCFSFFFFMQRLQPLALDVTEP